MKYMRKILAMALAVMMVMSLAIGASAESGTNTNDGKITIDKAIDGTAYSVYQLAKLESYDTEDEAYIYTPTEAWSAWLRTQTTYVTIDATTGYITWAEGADAAAFAKAAATYAKENNIAATASAVAEGTTVTFDNLNLGWYLVDSTVGTICSLDTTDKEVTIEEKNGGIPESDKKVYDGDSWEDSATASIGDKVEYKVTITAKKGATGYVLHDNMSAGLTFNNDVVVKVGNTELSKKENAEDTDYDYEVVTSGLSDTTCDFEVVFAQSYLDTITADTTIEVTYSATLNENAVIAGEGNKNSSHLDYGEESDVEGYDKPSTPPDEPKVYTYKFDLVKTDKDGALLTGAEFKLYESDGTTVIKLIKVDDNTYRVAKENETGAVEVIVVTDGDVTIKGLKNGTYKLEETKAPAGYNKLNEKKDVTINNADLDATVTEGNWTAGGVQVVNNSGSELPTTGGMGTTLFYVFGAAMVLGAAVLLITKRRMNVAE